jgi:transcriptional regulator with XRE-family HTH domain
MNLKAIFVRNLKKFRNIEGISQMKLAELCDTSLSYIGQIETGKRFPSIKLIEKMAAVFQVEPYRFFMDDSGNAFGVLDETTSFIIRLPKRIRAELIARLNAAIEACVKDTLSP